jgi:biopolymer transport protein ExbB
MEDAMEDQGASETVKLRRNLRVLFAIASVSTLLGLIGTIQGMIYAFREAEAVGTGKFAPLAKGIYVALVTTFAGLLVAIPVTVAYYFLVGRVEKVVSQINDEAGEFLEHYTGDVASPR